jgi:O-antigen ligase/Flp pilus assembly protein TadD
MMMKGNKTGQSCFPQHPNYRYFHLDWPRSMKNLEQTTGRRVEASHLKTAGYGGWLLLLILVPLWINLWGHQPFELSKAVLLRTLVWLLTGFILVEYARAERSLWRALQNNPLAGAAGLLALALVVTTITAVNWRLSLWGSYERGQGTVTLLTYILLFLLAAEQFAAPTRARQLIGTLVAVSAPIVLLSLGQALGWNPFGLVSDARSPIYATLGRANFVGAYLAMMVPLTLALLLIRSQPRWRAVWAALLVGQLVVIGLTLARTAWLATAVSLLLFLLLCYGPRLARRWRRLAWGGVTLLFSSGPLLLFWLGQRQGGSTAARLSIWQGAVELIRQRPLLGYGADSLGLIFPRVYPPELVYFQGRDFFVDRAHNLLLDWAIIAGLPGLLAFGLLLLLFVMVSVRALRRPLPFPQRALLAAILAAVLGNVANNLTSFDVTPTAMAVWLLMGVGVALTVPPAVPPETVMKKRPFRHWALSGLLLLGVGTAVWQLNTRPLLADIANRSSQRHAQMGDWEASVAAAERAVAHWPVEPAHHLRLSQAYWRQASANPVDAASRLAQAESSLLAARRLRPDDPVIWLQTAQFYESAAGQFGLDVHHLADMAYRKAATLSPNQAVVYTAWGRFHLERGDPETAAPLLRQAVILDGSYGEAYLSLGAAELALGRVEEALADYQEAVRLLPESSQAHAGLARCYWQMGRAPEAETAVAAALHYDPHNAQANALWQTIHNPP